MPPESAPPSFSGTGLGDGHGFSNSEERKTMKVPHLRALTLTAASLAMVTAVSATAASAEAASAGHVPHVATATASKPQGRMTAPVTGTFKNKAGRGTFTGKFVPKKFAVANGVLGPPAC
jgi:hypothetical protein